MRYLLPWICGLAALTVAAPALADPPGTGYFLHTFKKVRLTDKFWAEGVTVADFNRDGHLDISAGPYWYEGPDFTRRHEVFPATVTFERRKPDGTAEKIEGYEGTLGTTNAYSNAFLEFTADFNHDGWPDILRVNLPGLEAAWYENPGRLAPGEERPWKEHLAFDAVGTESPVLVDLFKNGHPILLCAVGDSLGYLSPDPGHPDAKWSFHAISPPLPLLRAVRLLLTGGKPFPFKHGLGYGDVNGDGRIDVLEGEGWWEQPASVQGDPPWKFHKWSFLRPRPAYVEHAIADIDKLTPKIIVSVGSYYRWPYCLNGAQMHLCDVNGDGLPDLISSIDAHGYGLAWFEQLPTRAPSGEIQFRTHEFVGTIPSENRYGVELTEMHAIAIADVDGDGLPDIVTGKRFWAHGPNGPDPETNAPAVLYWFQLVRQKRAEPRYIPHLIDSDSGVGTQFVTVDLLANGLTDVVVSNKKGLFVFLQQVRQVNREEWLRAQPRVQFPSAP